MVHVRDFSWQYFSKTGDVDAYLLYKQIADEPGEEPDLPGDEEGIENPPNG
jgi:hypothetical protein